jgi:hypothetical protein
MSARGGIIECMFDRDGFAAMMDERLERHCPSKTAQSAAMVEQICAASRLENRAAAAQLTAIGGLFGYRLSRCSDTEDWAVDTMDAVSAEVAATDQPGAGRQPVAVCPGDA